MTTTTTIAALEALNADALKSVDEAKLARLEELSDQLVSLIKAEKERRNPAPATATNGENNLAAVWSKEFTAERMAAYRAQQVSRRAIIREAVEHCATKPDLQARLKDLFAFELRELRPMAQDEAV
jgi:hypothetical protein